MGERADNINKTAGAAWTLAGCATGAATGAALSSAGGPAAFAGAAAGCIVGGFVADSVAGCGESNELFPSDMKVPQRTDASPETDEAVDTFTPEYIPDASPPGIGLGTTMQSCFGPLSARFGDIEAICPKPLEGEGAGECDPEFVETITAFRSEMEGLVRNEAEGEVSDWDAIAGFLSGEIDIPTTAIVALMDMDVRGLPANPYIHEGAMIVTFGDNRRELAGQLDDFSFIWNYDLPMNSMRCYFSHWESLEDANDYFGSTTVSFVNVGLDPATNTLADHTVASLQVKYDHYNQPDAQVRVIHEVAGDTGLTKQYSDTEYNMAVADYATQTVVDDGFGRMMELLETDEFPWFESGLFYWH